MVDISNNNRQKSLIETDPNSIPRWQANKKADISDVKPQSALSSAMNGDLDDNFDIFLKLFLTQMEHPDPTESNSSFEMTQSLLQFFLAHGQQTTNEKLGEINKTMETSQARSAEGWIGKDIVFEGNCFTFNGSRQEAEYDIDSSLDDAEIRIFNLNDELVDIMKIPKSAGRHNIDWDPVARKDKIKSEIQEGDIFKVSIHAVKERLKNGKSVLDGEGKKIIDEVNVPLRLKGKVSALDYEDGHTKPQLLVGKNIVEFSNAKRLHASAYKNNIKDIKLNTSSVTG